MSAEAQPLLVIACGALARELGAIKRANGWRHLRIQCLDARLHNRPAAIPERLRQAIRRARGRHRRIFVAYADCGTCGGIDRVLAEEGGIERLPGAHCYQFFAGARRFEQLCEEEPGTFYLTDFLTRCFDRLVVEALQLDRHPALIQAFFGNYRRLVYLSQSQDAQLLAGARRAARFLGLDFQHVHVGCGALNARLETQLRLAGEQSADAADLLARAPASAKAAVASLTSPSAAAPAAAARVPAI